MTYERRRRHFTIAFLLAAAVVGPLLLLASTNNNNEPSFIRNNHIEAQRSSHRRLFSVEPFQFADPKSVTIRSDSPIENNRNNCQIVYIMGVEGATHHGFSPIIEALAQQQIDPESGLKYIVDSNNSPLKAGLFGWFHARVRAWGFLSPPELGDPAFVRRVVKEICPNDGKKHVLIEWTSFPSGHEDDKRTYRVHRQHEWLSMTPEEIADSDEALRQPANMTAFIEAYSPYVDIKFMVLSRPFLETIASHKRFDGGPEIHSNVIRGFLLILRRFLDAHPFDLVNGSRLWTLVCVERVMAKHYENAEDVKVARRNILFNLADFLGWPEGECPHCFDTWRDSRKDPLKVLSPHFVDILEDHKKLLDGLWPPPGEEGVVEQQCGL